jgi:hypothetical protein
MLSLNSKKLLSVQGAMMQTYEIIKQVLKSVPEGQRIVKIVWEKA